MKKFLLGAVVFSIAHSSEVMAVEVVVAEKCGNWHDIVMGNEGGDHYLKFVVVYSGKTSDSYPFIAATSYLPKIQLNEQYLFKADYPYIRKLVVFPHYYITFLSGNRIKMRIDGRNKFGEDISVPETIIQCKKVGIPFMEQL